MRTSSYSFQRRRAQNRDSQQAYRIRKEEYVQGLQGEIVDLHLRHRDLWQSYLAQGRRVGLLREVTADLTSEIATMRHRQGLVSPVVFDNTNTLHDDQGCGLAPGIANVPRQNFVHPSQPSQASGASGNMVTRMANMGFGHNLQVPAKLS